MKRFYFQLIFTLTFLFSFNGFTQNCDPPTITCPSDVVVSNDPGQCGAIVSYDITAASNCSQTSASEDFEGPNFPVLGAGNGAPLPTILPDPTPGATNGTNVLSVITNAAGAPWQQAELTLQSGFELDLTGTDKRVSVDWYSATPFDALLKVENGGPPSATEAAHLGGGWQTLVFDFNNPEDCLGVANGVYQRVFFFNLWDIDAPRGCAADGNGWFIGNGNPGGSVASTTYVDNIRKGSQSLIFSENFIQSQQSPHCSTWQSFRASLLDDLPYTKVTIKGSNDPIGVSVTDPTKVLQLANGLRTGTPVSLSDGGLNWIIGTCGAGIEITASATGGLCDCSSGYKVRPCINPGNPNWGGVGATCSAPSQTLIIEFEVADDSGSGDLTIVSNPPSGSIFPIGTTTVTSTATDASGNTATCSFDVTVVSDEAPITCPANIAQNNDPGECGAQLTIDAPDTNDNCTVVSITNDFNGTSDASGFYPVGTTPVTWTVTYDGGGTPTPPDVALLFADTNSTNNIGWASEVLNQLNSSGVFSSVTAINVNNSTPSVGALQQYDAVIVYSLSAFQNGTVLGNNLAAYIDAGGGVVVNTFSHVSENSNLPAAALTGAIRNNNYLPLDGNPANFAFQVPLTMSIVDGSHPIMNGVTSFSGGSNSWNITNLSVQNGGTLLANWSNGQPLIAYNQPTNGRVVCLNFFPPSSNSRGDFWNINTDGAKIMANSLVWAAGTSGTSNTATCSFDVTIIDTEAPTIDCNSAGPQNSLTNESFENNNGHDSQGATNWTQFGQVFTLDQNVIGTAQNGDFFVKMFGGNSGLFQDLPVNAGDEIRGSVFMQNASFDPTGSGSGGQIKLEWQGVPGEETSDFFTATTSSQDVWTEVSVNAVAPAGATGVRFVIICNLAGGAIMYDNASLINNSQPGSGLTGNITVNNDPGECGANLTLATPATADNCEVVSITNDYTGTANASGFYPVGTTTVTWTVTDSEGLTSSCPVDITVEDTEAPTLDCAQGLTGDNVLNNPSFEDANGNNTPYNSPSWTRFGVQPFALNFAPLQDGNFYLKLFGTNTGLFQDHPVSAGDIVDASIYLKSADFDPFVSGCQARIKLEYNNGVVVESDPINGGSLPVNVWTQISISDVAPAGATSVRYVAAMGCSGAGAAMFDNASMTITTNPGLVGDVIVDNDLGQCGAQLNIAVPDHGDNCPGATLTNDFNGTGDASGFYPIGTTTVTWTITDAQNLTTSCSIDIIVNDTEVPTIACPGAITQDTDPNTCGAVVTFSVTSDDNCPNQSIAQTAGIASGSEFPVGTTTNTFVVTDASGNTATCSFDVIVEDKEAPTITCPGNITQDTDPSICGAVVTYSVTSADNCPNQSIAQTTGLASGSEFPVGTTTNTFVVTDASGNTAMCSFTVTVTDNEDPVAICPADITVSNDPGDCSAVVNFNTSFTDNCTGGSVIASPDSGSTFDVGTTPVTVTATDAAGNTNTCTFNVIVVDDEAPIVDCFNLTVTLDDDGNGGIDETAFIAANGSTDNCEIASISLSELSFSCDDIGGDLDELIISEYIDGTGNNDWIEIYNGTGNTIVLGDDINGSLVSYYSINIYSDGNTTPTSVGLLGSIGDRQVYKISHTDAPNIFDNPTNNFGSPLVVFDGNDAIALVNDGVAVDVIGVIGVNPGASWSSTSNSTNGTTLVRNETVQQGNVSSFVANFETEWTQFSQNDVSYLGDHEIEISDNANNVLLTVTDIHGNVATCEGSVTVVDATLPIALCQNVTVQLDADGNGSTTAQAVDNGSNDACGIASLGLSQTAFTCADVGPNQVTLTVTDSNGNVSTCNATVTVEDNVNPDVITEDITVQLDNTGNASITPNDVDDGSSDACGIVNTTVSPSSFTCADVNSPVTVTLTVTDTYGNVDSETAIVTVEDNVAPVAQCNDITVNLDANGDYALTTQDIDAIGLGSSDACGIASLAVLPNTFTCNEVGANTVTLTVTDVNGNSSTCDATVTVNGDIPTVSINAPEELPEFCQGAVLVLTTTATDAASYLWSSGETTESIEVGPLGGTFTVTVTSATNCTAEDTITVAPFDESTLLSAYTILAEDEVFLHGSNLVQSGGIGATDANGLIKLHQATNVIEFGRAANIVLNQGSTIVTPIYQPAEIPFPDFVFNDQSNNASPDVTINTNQSTTLNGSVYGTITVRQGATVTFSQSDIYIDELRTFDGAAIEFSGCANVFINTKFMLAQNGTINANGNNVVMYVNEDVQIEKGSYVRARIHSNGNELLAKGPNGNANNSGDLTQMIGLFIAKKVHGNKNVVWNADDLCAPCPINPTNAPIIGNVNDFGVDAFDVLTWPNPSDTEFNVQLKTLDLYSESYIEVFDISNKLVFTGTFKPQEVYAFGKELEGGVYIVKVQQGQKSKTIRLVKY